MGDVVRSRFQPSLLGLQHHTLSSPIVIIGAQHHHVLDAKMLLLGPRDDVMVLEDRMPTFAATETSLLSQGTCDRRRSVRALANHGSRTVSRPGESSKTSSRRDRENKGPAV